MINATDISKNITKGEMVTLTLTDHTTVTGEYVSVNTKGVNIKVDGKVVSRGLARIAEIDHPTEDGDVFVPGTDYTAKALATIFGTSARRLRVQLRKLGLGVGQGHMYHLTADQARNVRNALSA
jgi:hypothetical protein